MDNILKYVLAVLGVAALIALIVPEKAAKPDNDVSALKPIAPAPVAPAGPIPPAAQQDDSSDEEPMDDWEEEYQNFGQPMNNAQPVGAEGGSANSEAVASPGMIPIAPTASPSIGNRSASETSQTGE